MRINPLQELPHLNLGWLLLPDDAAAAEGHFVEAARLVPDKGSVYLGLGLARLNQGQPARATHALALECLNDPRFLVSPLWKDESLAGLRDPTLSELDSMLQGLQQKLPADSWPGSEVRYVRALAAWVSGRAEAENVAQVATTAARRAFFATNPDRWWVSASGAVSYQRARGGYPVLSRIPDMPPPVDVFGVIEEERTHRELGFLFPNKGWLPTRLLVERLGNPDQPKP